MSIIGAIGNVIGGFLNRSHAEDINQRNLHQAQLNRDAQAEFARNSIRWRVEDARRAGIHPIYALGAPTMSPAPITAGQVADTSLGASFGAAGQDLSRAINATRTQPERADALFQTMRELEVKNMALRNDLLAAQISKVNQAGGTPAFPSLTGDTRSTKIFENAPAFETPRIEAQAQKVEDEYGEFTGDVSGAIRAFRDMLRSHGVPLGQTPSEYSKLLGNYILSDAAKTSVSVMPGSIVDRLLGVFRR